MITKISVRNFLSLKEVDLDLRLRNVLVGPNMSGKTNLIEAFKFLTSTMTVGMNKTLLDRGGYQEVLWKGNDGSAITLGVTAEIPSEENDSLKTYEYSVSIIGSASGQFSIESERLAIHAGAETKEILDIHAGGRGQLDIGDGKGLSPVDLSDRGRSALEYIGLPSFEGTRFKNFVSAWRFYHLLPAAMRLNNPPTPQTFLTEPGENFSSWLMTIQTHPEEFRRLRQAASDVLPDLTELLIQPTQFATISLSSREKHLKRPVGILRMSDGELAFLALLSLILAPEELASPLYCIEEPENNLHPYLLETLVEALTQRQQELGVRAAQIIATTHSPYLVDKLNLEDLVVVEKVNGQTTFKRPSSDKNLKELLTSKEIGLGDLWYSGALSDR